MNPPGHTRLPAYLRGRPGRIERVLGTMAFADARACGDRCAAQTAYTVRFAAADVFGVDADPAGAICADLFESYLEPGE
jgi:nitrile hydratase